MCVAQFDSKFASCCRASGAHRNNIRTFRGDRFESTAIAMKLFSANTFGDAALESHTHTHTHVHSCYVIEITCFTYTRSYIFGAKKSPHAHSLLVMAFHRTFRAAFGARCIRWSTRTRAFWRQNRHGACHADDIIFNKRRATGAVCLVLMYRAKRFDLSPVPRARDATTADVYISI